MARRISEIDFFAAVHAIPSVLACDSPAAATNLAPVKSNGKMGNASKKNREIALMLDKAPIIERLAASYCASKWRLVFGTFAGRSSEDYVQHPTRAPRTYSPLDALVTAR
jgi:hypothetical protein